MGFVNSTKQCIKMFNSNKYPTSLRTADRTVRQSHALSHLTLGLLRYARNDVRN